MSERLRTIPPHGLMPRSILRLRTRRGNNLPVAHLISRIPNRVSADDHYGAGFSGDVSGHVVKKPSGVNRRQEHFDKFIEPEFIGHVDVVPGNPLYVTAQLSGVIINGEFEPQPAKKPEDPLVLAAKARIGLNQEGFLAVSAGVKILKMRVVDAGGLRQKVSVETPSYDPCKLVVEYRNGFIIASA